MGTSSITWPDQNLSKKLIGELVQGRDLAAQLQGLLHKPVGEHGSVSVAGELAGKILNSFTETLSVLTSSSSNTTATNSNNVLQCSNGSDVLNLGGAASDQINGPDEPASHVDLHSQCGDRSSEDAGEISTKKRSALKDRRGCYKRRKGSQSWTKVTHKIEDGQAWRKYGQKEILNAKYPRAYFRCTRKHDQGCRALKQVQQIQDNPKLYQATYIGHHTCKNILKAPQMIISDYEHPWNSANNYNVVVGSHDHLNISPNNSKSAAKQDQIVKEEAPSDHDQDNASFDTTRDENSDSLWPNEFKDLELSDPSIDLLSLTKNMAASDNDHDDVVSVMFSFQVDQRTSYTSDDHDLEMDDFVVKSTNFRDIQFDEIEFSV
ncbi:hypothetical protein TIFTF001_010351 [Ficus carica]|uniref:WRKY domain-containing protein n=1 Tax=Ficus carica TaxID=3494 RepID=A0AA87ZWW2_FICCA|nr:hypothetical protein TIFTF001_010351 [Ficus carica]